MNLVHPPLTAPNKWRLDFEWSSLSPEQRARLLVVIGDCDGEWWGEGRAEFPSCEAAVKVVAFAARLDVQPPALASF